MKGLTHIRKKFGLTMKELGEKIGVSSNTINLWEKDKLEPTEERIKQLEDFFKLPNYLFFKENFDEDDIIDIENSRFECVVRGLHKSKYTSDFMNKYLRVAIEKPGELIYFLDYLKDAFNNLEADDFLYMINTFVSMIDICLRDVKNINKINMLVGCLDYDDDEEDLLNMNKEHLIESYIIELVKQWGQITFNESKNKIK